MECFDFIGILVSFFYSSNDQIENENEKFSKENETGKTQSIEKSSKVMRLMITNLDLNKKCITCALFSISLTQNLT